MHTYPVREFDENVGLAVVQVLLKEVGEAEVVSPGLENPGVTKGTPDAWR